MDEGAVKKMKKGSEKNREGVKGEGGRELKRRKYIGS